MTGQSEVASVAGQRICGKVSDSGVELFICDTTQNGSSPCILPKLRHVQQCERPVFGGIHVELLERCRVDSRRGRISRYRHGGRWRNRHHHRFRRVRVHCGVEQRGEEARSFGAPKCGETPIGVDGIALTVGCVSCPNVAQPQAIHGHGKQRQTTGDQAVSQPQSHTRKRRAHGRHRDECRQASGGSSFTLRRRESPTTPTACRSTTLGNM